MNVNSEPVVVAVSGFSSNVGKTTLVCELLRRLHGWEAIKLSRGHYRSCGKDPIACCVSDLLGAEPVVRSGREANYERGKDTGRFWDVGATNVHWTIVSDEQVEQGIKEAISRVRAPGVIIEGNSFLQYVRADFVVMCARSEGGKVKPSAREVLHQSDVLYLSTLKGPASAKQEFEQWRSTLSVDLQLDHLLIVTADDLPQLVEMIQNARPADDLQLV